MEPLQHIESFLKSVRRRLHLRRFLLVGAWALLGVGAVLLIVALSYVVRGYAVPGGWYLVSVSLGLASTLLAWLVMRENVDQAASYADRHFGLQDTLLSWLHFRRREQSDGFYALQAEQTAESVENLNAQAVDWRPPRRLAVAALTLVVLAAGLGFKGPSQSVLDRLALEEFTLAQTEVLNRDLQELVREIDEQADDQDEREMLKPDQLREMVEALRETNDQKKALRQYARLESEVQKMRTGLEQRRDEQLLAEAAKELQNERETRPLGQQLSQQKYKEAAEQLADWKPESKRSLSEQQKQLARLKAASQRMAAAARNQRGRSGSQSANRGDKGQNSTARSGASGGQSGAAAGAKGEDGGELGEAIESLANSVEDLDDSLARAAREERESGKCDASTLADCQACQESVAKDLDRLSRQLTKMAIRCEARKKLDSLCKACSQCQGGLCQSLVPCPKPGGKQAGWGSDLARRDVTEELLDSGEASLLQGIKGEGPSQTTVETADEGTGVSGRATVARKRTFERQFESFVSREDVPEQVKAGVKNYFQSIHQVEGTP